MRSMMWVPNPDSFGEKRPGQCRCVVPDLAALRNQASPRGLQIAEVGGL
jgi:hypothetical protein